MPSEAVTPAEAASRPETLARIVKLARLAILATVIFGGVLLLADLAVIGRVQTHDHFLSQAVAISLFWAIAAEVVVAAAVAVCLEIWRK